MLKKWRSLVVTGVMLSALVLLGTTTALAQPPAKGPKPTVAQAGANGLTVSWNTVTFQGRATEDDATSSLVDITATSYTVAYSKGRSSSLGIDATTVTIDSTTTPAIVTAPVQSLALTGLEAGTEYTVAVNFGYPAGNRRDTAAAFVAGTSPYSDVTTEMTDYAPASTPMKPTLTVTGYDSIRVRWTPNPAADGVTGYSLFYKAGSSISIGDANATRMEFGKDAIETDLTGLMPATEYAVALLATNPKGQTALSEISNATTNDAPTPDRVAQPTLTEEGDGSLTFDWSAPAAGGTGITIERYMVQFQEVGDASWLDWNPSPTMSEVTLTGLTNGKTYRVQVKAMNSVGGASEDWSIPASGTPMEPTAPPPPPEPELTAPTGVMAAAGDGMIEVSWNAVDGADSYEVSWMSASGGATSTDTTMETSYTIENVMNGMEYSVQVSSVKGDMKSTASTAVTATPEAPPLDAPMNVMVEAGDGMIMASWDAVDRADSYKVSWSAGGVTSSATAMGTSHTIENLMNGTEYSVTVSAMMGDMEGPASAAMMATPMPADPVPALPLFGMLALGAGLVAAGRRRLRAQRLLNN